MEIQRQSGSHEGATFPDATAGELRGSIRNWEGYKPRQILSSRVASHHHGFSASELWPSADGKIQSWNLVRWSPNLTLNKETNPVPPTSTQNMILINHAAAAHCCHCHAWWVAPRQDLVCFLLLLSLRLLCARVCARCNSHLFVWQFWWNLKISRFVMDINSSCRTMAVRAARVKTNVAFMWRGCYVLEQAGWPGGWDSFREETTISALSLAAAADLSQAPPRRCIDRQCSGSEETILRGCRYPGEIIAD